MKRVRLLLISFMALLGLLVSSCGNPYNTADLHTGLFADAAWSPLVAADGQGNTIVVWLQSSGVYANRHAYGSGWGAAQKIAEFPSLGWSDMHFAVSKNGQAVVAWCQSELDGSSVRTVRYSPVSGWGAVENLADVGTPKDVGVADNGDVFLAAEYSTGLTDGVALARFHQGTGWSRDLISHAGSSGNGHPRIAVGGSGEGFLVWAEDGSDTSHLYASRLSSIALGAPELIASAGGPAAWTNVSLDLEGNAMVVWGQQPASGHFHSYGCRYGVSSGWGPAVQIDNSDFDCVYQTLSADGGGNLYAAWTQRDGTGTSAIYSARYQQATGWQTPQRASSTGYVGYPHIAVTSTGDLFATWQRWGLNDLSADATVVANIFSPGLGWASELQIRSANGSASPPEVATDQSGAATLIWSQSTGSVDGTTQYAIYYTRVE